MTGIFDQITAQDKNQQNTQVADEKSNENLNTPDPESYTQKQIKEVSQQLLKYGLLESTTKPKLYRSAVIHQTKLNEILEPLDLAIKIDDIRGLAFVVVVDCDIDNAEDDQWSHPLVRRQRLNLEQSLLIAILRKHFMAHELESGIGDDAAVVHLDDLLPELNSYLGEMGSETREDKRLRNLLDQLKTYSVVSDVNEHEQVTIRPLIAHVANPENLRALLLTFINKNNTSIQQQDS